MDVTNIELKNIAFDASLIDFSISLLRTLGYKLPILIENEKTEILERLFKDMIIDIVASNGMMKIDSIIKTNHGEASLAFNVSVKNNSKIMIWQI